MAAVVVFEPSEMATLVAQALKLLAAMQKGAVVAGGTETRHSTAQRTQCNNNRVMQEAVRQ